MGKISKRRLEELLIYVPILVAILFSKTAYFGIANRSTFQWVYYGIAGVAFLVGRGSIRTFNQNMKGIIVFIVCIMMIAVFHFSDKTSDAINAYLGIVLSLIATGLLASSISRIEFQKKYVDIMFLISLVSIPCFLIAVFRPDIAKQLAITPMHYTNLYEYSWFYTWGRRGVVIPRNHGPFWEPGAFQGFIILAILFMVSLDLDKVEIKNKRFIFITLFITLLTTASTTGYILCIFIMFFFFEEICSFISDDPKYKKVTKLMIGILVIATVAFIILSNNISDKLNGVYTQSASVRSNDLAISFQAMFSLDGLLGYGMSNAKLIFENSYDLGSNSVGLFSMAYTYGFAFWVLYMRLMWLGIRRVFPQLHGTAHLWLYIVLIVLHLTEGLWNLPVYLLLLMHFNERKV